MREIIGHEKILKKILHDRGLDAKDLARLINYSETNYPKAFNKETYTKKMIEKISSALGIDPSVFTNTLVNGDNHGTVTQTINADERATYEERLRDKQEIIDGLREKLKRYEDSQLN